MHVSLCEKFSELEKTLRDEYDRREKIHRTMEPGDIPFGKIFSDHMLLCTWKKGEGWAHPKIVPFGEISISPACIALHYGCEVSTISSENCFTASVIVYVVV